MSMDTCANCGGQIGKIETPFVFDDHVVCAACWKKLRDAQAASIPVAIPYESSAPRSVVTVSHPTPGYECRISGEVSGDVIWSRRPWNLARLIGLAIIVGLVILKVASGWFL